MTDSSVPLLDKLREIHEREQRRPASERREAVMRAIRAELDKLPDDAARSTLAALRGALGAARPGAPADDGRAADLEAENAKLRAALERERAAAATAAARAGEGSGAAAATIRDLEAKVAGFEARLRSTPAAPAPDAGPSALVETLRRGIRETVDGKRPTAQSLGLPEEQARLFRFIQALVRFLLDLEQLRLGMLKEHEVGTAGGGTQMVRLLASQLKGRMRDVLDDKKGSLQALETTLRANQHFPLALDQAYREACSEAVIKLMGELKTDTILEANKRIFGYDYEAAWKEIAKRLFDLGQMHAMEIWALYLKEPFQERMNALKPGE